MKPMCRGMETDHRVGPPTCPLGEDCTNPDRHSSSAYECNGPDQYGPSGDYCEVCRSRLTACPEPITLTELPDGNEDETCALGHDVPAYTEHGHWHPRTADL